MKIAQITAPVPDEVAEALDAAATLKRSRAEAIRQALDRYLEDFDDRAVAFERLRDPSDPVLDWEEIRRELLDAISPNPPEKVSVAAGCRGKKVFLRIWDNDFCNGKPARYREIQ